MSLLNVNLKNINFSNPVWVASGTFGFGEEFSKIFDINQLGAIVTKTITPEFRPGNPPPRTIETPSGMLNSIGLANPGIKKFVTDKIPFLKKLKAPVIVNIAGESISEFCMLIEELEKYKFLKGYEINISCPNVEKGGMLFGTDAEFTSRLTGQLRKLTKKLLIVKLTPNVTDITEIAKAAEGAGADALSLINTVVGMAVDINRKKPFLGNVFGGLSGPAIKPVALANLYKVKKSVKLPLIGVGGITSTDDAVEFFMTGASCIQVGTANFFEPTATKNIIDGLEKYCIKNKLSSINQLTGVIH